MSDDERPKLSWAEIDKRRDGARGKRERGPRGEAAEALSRGATDQYLKKLDRTLFAKEGKGGAGESAAKTVLDAQGSADLIPACQHYLENVGPPQDFKVIAAFLDCRDRSLQITALRALEARLDAESVELPRALLSQVRMLADELDDALAEAAEDALAKIPA